MGWNPRTAIDSESKSIRSISRQYSSNSESIKELRKTLDLSQSDCQTNDNFLNPIEYADLTIILNDTNNPIISKIKGNVYAGGYIYLACSTYVIAADHLEFSLPEIKRGLFPMQVMGVLMRIMMPR